MRRKLVDWILYAVIGIGPVFFAYCVYRALGGTFSIWGTVRGWFVGAQLGTVGEWLAAFFTAAAAWVALFIATRDRRERNAERLAADEAEAKLIFTGVQSANPVTAAYRESLPQRQRGQYDTHPHYTMWVRNESQRPILDITVIGFAMRSEPNAVVKLREKDWARAVLKPEAETNTCRVEFHAQDDTRLPNPKPEQDRGLDVWPTPEELEVVGWLGFSDVNGNRWARSSEGELRRITRPVDIERLTR